MNTWQLRIRRLTRMNTSSVDRAALRSSGAAAETHGCPSTPRDRSGARKENERAAGRIIILPGGGITWENAEDVAAALGVHEVHGTKIVRVA